MSSALKMTICGVIGITGAQNTRDPTQCQADALVFNQKESK
jgi:hypothetical protein